MFYEYLLISVVIASGWWGFYFVRHQPNGTPLFGVMHLAAALGSGLGLIARNYEDAPPALGILGAIGLGGGTCLLIVGPLVRGIARRFAAAERIGVASRLLDVAEILAPGSGVAEEKALLGAMREIREGRVEQTVDALTAAKDSAPVDARLAIDERIAMLYLAAYRWSDAINYAETHIIPSLRTPDAITPQMSLRDALGIAPPVWIELLGAYGRTGDLDTAAAMMAKLEDACAGRSVQESSLWLHRGRMMFLALAGRPDAVGKLVAKRQARHMSAAARTYWFAVALQHHGDRDAARTTFQRARSRSRGRPRVLIDEALAKLPDSTAVTLSPAATEVVSKVEAMPLPAPVRLATHRAPWVTYAVTAILIGVAGFVELFVGDSNDLGVLVRSGALVRGEVDHGEWWRLISCGFLHIGPLHLVVNAIGIYLLGRVLEELFGPSRTLAIYAGAAVAGAVASYYALSGGISAGASGAIFGVLGAVFIELTLHRDRYRSAWKRGMWGGLAVVTVAQIAIGFLYPVIDQWAHGGGLIAGLVLGAALSPNVRWARIGLAIGRVLAIGYVGLVIAATVLVARTSIADTYGRTPLVRYEFDDLAYTAPAGWTPVSLKLVENKKEIGITHDLINPDSLIIASAMRRSSPSLQSELDDWLVRGEANVMERGVTAIESAPDTVIPLPGWRSVERIGVLDDAMGQTQRWRVVFAARYLAGDTVVVLLLTPDTIARAIPTQLAALLDSIEVR